ncbi:MAG: hypothetical protein Kow0068_00350 [Marinilabiliales bacterium]
MKKTILFLILGVLLLVDVAEAQRSARWRRMRYEVIYGVGATNFLGELGGANRIGTNFVRDLEIVATRPLLSLGMRYKLLEDLSVKAALTGGMLSGNDNLTNETFRHNRNLSFRSFIVEFGSQIEYSIIREKIGHRYNLRRVRGVRGFKTNTYFFVGLAGFYHNPMAKYPVDGKWYSLQPLCTEGQGLVPTRKKYSRFQVAIPYGVGFKYGLDRKWSIGLEFGVRKTFTDYLDDVSTTYFDNQMIEDNYGPVAAYFADPSLAKQNNDLSRLSWTGTNTQRGDAKDKDTYMFAIINLTYKLRTTRTGLPKF